MKAIYRFLFFFIDAIFAAIYFPNLRLICKHTNIEIDKYVKGLIDSPFNHPFVGYTVEDNVNGDINRPKPAPSSSYRTNYLSVNIGEGQERYKRASNILKSFSMIKMMGWTEIHCMKSSLPVTANIIDEPRGTVSSATSFNLNEGQPLCTLAKCFGFIWVLNPCRIVKSSFDVSKPPIQRTDKDSADSITMNQIAFSTVNGHLLAGEERFRVIHNKDTNQVVFDMYSFSKPANVLGLIALPYVRHVQKSFFKDQASCMKQLLTCDS